MAQLLHHKVIRRLAAGNLETNGLAAYEEGADIDKGLKLRGLECDDHPPMVPDSRQASGSCHVG